MVLDLVQLALRVAHIGLWDVHGHFLRVPRDFHDLFRPGHTSLLFMAQFRQFHGLVLVRPVAHHFQQRLAKLFAVDVGRPGPISIYADSKPFGSSGIFVAILPGGENDMGDAISARVKH